MTKALKKKKMKYKLKKRKRSLVREPMVAYNVQSLQLPPVKILSSVKTEPYYKRDNFVLYNSDSIKFLKELPENSIDMIFADPPYLLSNGGFSVHAGKMVSVNKGDWDKSNGLEKDFEF
jgi:hypothetical protein